MSKPRNPLCMADGSWLAAPGSDDSMIQFGLLSAQRPQRFPDFAIDARGILRGLIDEFDPAAAVGIEFGVTEEIAALQDGLQRIAKVVRQ